LLAATLTQNIGRIKSVIQALSALLYGLSSKHYMADSINDR